MTDYKRMNRLLHSIIGVNLFFIFIFLSFGLRPIFIVGTLALGIFFVDYFLFPFTFLYEAFIQWLPLLFELNIFNGILTFNRIFHISKFWSIGFLSISLIRSIIVIYYRHLPLDDHHRLSIENKIQILSKWLLKQATYLYDRFLQLFHSVDDNELDKFQLEQIKSDENSIHDHDETIQRFQNIADQFSSPTISNIDCSTNATPPIHRHHHHQRLRQQNENECFSRTPITPIHADLPRGKILHSTVNGSYDGPMTRNRTRTGSKPSILKSPGTNKTPTDVTFLISK